MADLFKALKPKASLSKNGFDLSRKHVFSSKAGQCLPVLALETVPGDYHEIDVTALTRTRTMNTAAFLRGKQRYDFFFVPYSQLWHPFNQFITQRDDKHSTTQKGHIYAPVVSLGDILIHIIQENLNNSEDLFDFPYDEGMIRILDLLGYGDFRWLLTGNYNTDTFQNEIMATYGSKYVNVFRLAAYQHIWYDYYRNKYYDVVNSGGISASDPDLAQMDYIFGFNFDDLECSSFANSQLHFGTFNQSGQPDNDSLRLRMLLKMNYIQWKKDLFTSALPSQQFGAVSSVDISGGLFANSYSNSDSTLNFLFASTSSGRVSLSNNSTQNVRQTNFSIPSAFDVLSLRKAEALQAWKQNTLRAGNMTDDSYKAHYGVEPYYDGDENVNYLGSVSAAVQVNSVESTASSSVSGTNNRVGDLAATGTIVVKGNKVTFNARDFGIIMCIASFLPESEYSSNCIDKANTLHEQFDWFTPEFQDIGLEPVMLYQNTIGGIDISSINTVLGYAPRYSMYKQAVDKVFGEFKQTESVDLASEQGTLLKSGSYAAWVAPRKEYVLGSNRDLATFYVTPRVLDNIFGVQAGAYQSTDCFINNVYFDIKSIRPMSVLGLPQF